MKLKIDIDGKHYEAEIEVIEDERVAGTPPARAPHKRSDASPSVPPLALDTVATGAAAEDKLCRSSIVGIVVQVLISPGQRVAQGEKLLVLEAMKMESSVNSPIDGAVKTILVNQGDSVKKGQVLVEFA